MKIKTKTNRVAQRNGPGDSREKSAREEVKLRGKDLWNRFY